MAKGKKPGFLLRHEWSALLRNIESDHEFRQAVMAIMDYSETGFIDPHLGTEARLAFSFFKERVDKDSEKYNDTCESRRAAGKLGGRPRKTKAIKTNQMISDEIKQDQLVSYATKHNQKNPSSSSLKEYDDATEEDDSFFDSIFVEWADKMGVAADYRQLDELGLTIPEVMGKMQGMLEMMSAGHSFSHVTTPYRYLRTFVKREGVVAATTSPDDQFNFILSALAS